MVKLVDVGLEEVLLANTVANTYLGDRPTARKAIRNALERYRKATRAEQADTLEKVLDYQRGWLENIYKLRKMAVCDNPDGEKLAVSRMEEQQAWLQLRIAELRTPPVQVVPEWEELVPEFREEQGKQPEPYMVPAHNFYPEMLSTFAARDFDPPDENEKWPHKTLTKPGKSKAGLRMRPPDESLKVPEEHLAGADLELWQNRMLDQVLTMSDRTADVLECVFARYLEQARHPKDSIWVTAGDILEMRGARHHSKGGWRPEDKRDVAMEIHRLNCAWLRIEQETRVEEVTLKNGQTKNILKRGPLANVLDTKIFNVTSKAGQKLLFGGEEFTAWRISMGEVLTPFLFGVNRNFALVSRKVLALNPRKQWVEKRLGRYLSIVWRWRCKDGDLLKPFKVRTLVGATRLEDLKKFPSQRRARLEQALDTLQQEQVIAGWQYEDGYRGAGNHEEWLETNVVIEPPEFVKDQAAKINRPPRALPTAKKEDTGPAWDPAALVAARRRRGLTQLQAVEELQDLVAQRGLKQKMGRTYYTQIESGKKHPKEALKKLLMEWAKK